MLLSQIYSRKTGHDLLYNIMPIANLPSVFMYGILSNNEMKKRGIHISVADCDVQARRERVTIPNKLPLHDYANLYFDAHNPMLSRVRDRNDKICVLGIDVSVLDLKDVVVSDMNAAREFAGFYDVSGGFDNINFDKVFAKYWNTLTKGIKCAEVLVPHRMDPKYIKHIFVANKSVRDAILSMNSDTPPISIDAEMFF